MFDGVLCEEVKGLKAEILNAFLRATTDTLRTETADEVSRVGLAAINVPNLTDDVTVVLAVVGNPRGLVQYGMSTETTLAMAGAMVGQSFPEINDLVLSGVAELGNVITGRASMFLSQMQYECDITPPSVMVGKGARFSTLGITRIVIPVQTRYGPFHVYVALQTDT